MTLDEIKNLFGTTDGVFYRINKNKTEVEILTDANQSIATRTDPSGMYIRVETEFTHADYTKVE